MMEGSEDTKEEQAAAAPGPDDEKVSPKTSPSTTQDNLSNAGGAGSRLSAASKNSAGGSRLSGEPKAPSRPQSSAAPSRPQSSVAPDKTEEEEEECKDPEAGKEEEAKLVPKSKSKDSVKREEIVMNDYTPAPPVAAPRPSSTCSGAGPATETHDVEVGKQNGATAHPEKDAGKKTLVHLMKKKEVIICFIGGVTFLIGLIMIIVGLMVMQEKCDRQLQVSATRCHYFSVQ